MASCCSSLPNPTLPAAKPRHQEAWQTTTVLTAYTAGQLRGFPPQNTTRLPAVPQTPALAAGVRHKAGRQMHRDRQRNYNHTQKAQRHPCRQQTRNPPSTKHHQSNSKAECSKPDLESNRTSPCGLLIGTIGPPTPFRARPRKSTHAKAWQTYNHQHRSRASVETDLLCPVRVGIFPLRAAVPAKDVCSRQRRRPVRVQTPSRLRVRTQPVWQ